MMGDGKDIDMYKKVYYFGYIFTADKGSGKNMSNQIEFHTAVITLLTIVTFDLSRSLIFPPCSKNETVFKDA